MIITVLNVELGKGAKNGRAWETAEVSYKDENGKVTSKKLMSFNGGVFDTFKSASSGMRFDVASVKNDKGYWDWVSAQEVSGAPAAGPIADAPQPGNGGKVNTYNDPRETKEERARRQTLITRQACLNSAIASLGSNVGDLSPDAVMNRAFEFERWVNRLDIAELEDDPI